MMYIFAPIYGRVADALGPTVVIVPASILVVFAICMLSLSTQYYQIVLSEGIAFGIGAGGLFLIPMVAIPHWFTSKRGLAIGVAASGSSIGMHPLFDRCEHTLKSDNHQEVSSSLSSSRR